MTETVPVQREEVRVEREPITDANVDDAIDGPDISEEEHEVTLRAEEPVVEKRAVPKERVRLEKDIDTDEREVSERCARSASTSTTSAPDAGAGPALAGPAPVWWWRFHSDRERSPR